MIRYISRSNRRVCLSKQNIFNMLLKFFNEFKDILVQVNAEWRQYVYYRLLFIDLVQILHRRLLTSNGLYFVLNKKSIKIIKPVVLFANQQF